MEKYINNINISSNNNNMQTTPTPTTSKTPKPNNKKNIQSIKGNILLLANKLLNDKKLLQIIK